METPSRAEPVAQEDKTKLLKAAFLQFCRCVTDSDVSASQETGIYFSVKNVTASYHGDG